MEIKRWDKFHCLAMLLVCLTFLVTNRLLYILIIAASSFLILWISNWKNLKKPVPGGSYANHVTLLRLLGLITIGLFSQRLTNFQVCFGLSVVAIFDYLDGLMARKFNQKSTFGTYFDMETDALFVCVASILLFQKGITGWWIFIPGFMRYIYVAIIFFLRLNNINEKRTKIGPVIATIMFISLCAAFVIPWFLASLFLIIATLLLIFSFSYSFILALNTGKRIKKPTPFI